MKTVGHLQKAPVTGMIRPNNAECGAAGAGKQYRRIIARERTGTDLLLYPRHPDPEPRLDLPVNRDRLRGNTAREGRKGRAEIDPRDTHRMGITRQVTDEPRKNPCFTRGNRRRIGLPGLMGGPATFEQAQARAGGLPQKVVNGIERLQVGLALNR